MVLLWLALACSPAPQVQDGLYDVYFSWSQDRDYDAQAGPNPVTQKWALFQEGEDTLKVDTYVRDGSGEYVYVSTLRLEADGEGFSGTFDGSAACGDQVSYIDLRILPEAEPFQKLATTFSGAWDDWWQPHSCPEGVLSGDPSCTCDSDDLERRWAFDLDGERNGDAP